MSIRDRDRDFVIWSHQHRQLAFRFQNRGSITEKILDKVGVYIVCADDVNRFKIGYTQTSFRGRLSGLQSGSPVTLRLVGLIPGASIEYEKYLHERFAHSRVHREWFASSPELLAFLGEPA